MKNPVYYELDKTLETAFSVAASNMKFGPGVLTEVGADARLMGMSRVALFTDRNVAATPALARVEDALKAAGLDVAVNADAHVEPTDASFLAAAEFARDGKFDGYVSLGGGSVMDTAKAANLLATWPDDIMAYVNAPTGGAKPVPGPIKPHIACPTTCGTGSETTTVAVFDLVKLKMKTGISSRFLKPGLAVVDPETISTLPGGAIASTGFDVLTHAIESYTARPFSARGKPASPTERPPYQGANPWSDIGSIKAIELGGKYLLRAVRDKSDIEARDALMFAATLAGMSFGNAGVHLPHAMSYSVAGLNHSYRAKGYENADPMVPHGIAVVIDAPAAFRFTAEVAPERHLEAARALGADIAGVNDPGEALAGRLIDMMRETEMPNGLNDLGYGEDDIPELVKGAFEQQRLHAGSPRPVSEADFAAIYKNAMRYW